MYRTYTALTCVFSCYNVICNNIIHNMLIILVFISMHYEMLKCESQWNKIKNKTLKTIFLFWPSYSSHSVSNRSQISNLGSWLHPSNRKRNHNWAFLLEFPNCLLGRNNLSNFTGPISRLRELQAFSEIPTEIGKLLTRAKRHYYYWRYHINRRRFISLVCFFIFGKRWIIQNTHIVDQCRLN